MRGSTRLFLSRDVLGCSSMLLLLLLLHLLRVLLPTLLLLRVLRILLLLLRICICLRTAALTPCAPARVVRARIVWQVLGGDDHAKVGTRLRRSAVGGHGQRGDLTVARGRGR